MKKSLSLLIFIVIVGIVYYYVYPIFLSNVEKTNKRNFMREINNKVNEIDTQWNGDSYTCVIDGITYNSSEVPKGVYFIEINDNILQGYIMIDLINNFKGVNLTNKKFSVVKLDGGVTDIKDTDILIGNMNIKVPYNKIVCEFSE